MADVKPLKIDLVKLYNGHKCLIIDDLPEVRGSVKRMLSGFGFKHVDTAANAEDTLKMCSAKTYTLIFCDYNLGRSQDGQHLLENLRKSGLLPITSMFVMITAETSREMVLGALESQPDDYITKPFTPKLLSLRVDRLLIKDSILHPIKALCAQKQFSEAVEACNKVIEEGSKVANDAQRLKGRILIRLGELHEARAYYEAIVEKTPVPWAMLGLAETLVELGEHDLAEIILKKVLEIDNRYVEAHDLLSRIHKSRRNLSAAQESTEEACRLSPKSVVRHRRLAQLAELNDDEETALNAYKQAIQWSPNSPDEDAQDYLNYARKATEVIRLNPDSNHKEHASRAQRMLSKAQELKDFNEEIERQVALISANIHQVTGTKDSKEMAQNVIDEFRESPPNDCNAHLDYVRVLNDNGQTKEATEHLQAMAAEYGDDIDMMSRIERLSSEPLTQRSKEKVVQLTREGITAYDKGDHQNARKVFREALGVFPKHVGLNLNLVQVLLEHNAQLSDEDAQEVQKCFSRINTLDTDHPQHNRFASLQDNFAKAKSQLTDN
ncbi:tetratricopeptide repeat protein [Marinibactrum halimedae]|uniref:tetratricopeptide repeat protein n=1 Tax=Marinibactrum halimedae TaxID=1444977 RepID=UPI001E434A7A|nr:tetratricopeptide repeat protein [Marinibactrum halimedae]MCD9459961.1 response regulator [Marinibactrum halimedae]